VASKRSSHQSTPEVVRANVMFLRCSLLSSPRAQVGCFAEDIQRRTRQWQDAEADFNSIFPYVMLRHRSRSQIEPISPPRSNVSLGAVHEPPLQLSSSVEVLEGSRNALGHALLALTNPDTRIVVPVQRSVMFLNW